MSDDATSVPLCTFLPWDTEFFGFRIGRANSSVLTTGALSEILRWGATERIRCLYFSADGESAETLALAATGGFQFVDARLDFRLPLGVQTTRPATTTSVRHVLPTEIEGIATLAKRSHLDSRFFKDRGFPVDRAEALYAEWIRRDHRQHMVLVAIPPGGVNPIGYVTCQIATPRQTGRISLIAVDPTRHGRGIGRALVEAALKWFRAAECSEVLVTTQASNVAAQRLYQSAGFRTASSSVWFHCWFPSNP